MIQCHVFRAWPINIMFRHPLTVEVTLIISEKYSAGKLMWTPLDTNRAPPWIELACLIELESGEFKGLVDPVHVTLFLRRFCGVAGSTVLPGGTAVAMRGFDLSLFGWVFWAKEHPHDYQDPTFSINVNPLNHQWFYVSVYLIVVTGLKIS